MLGINNNNKNKNMVLHKFISKYEYKHYLHKAILHIYVSILKWILVPSV